MNKLYHVARAGQEIGRYVLADLERAIRQGDVRGTDHCWTEGMDGWMLISAIPGLASAAPAASPPAPPPVLAVAATVHRNSLPGQVVCTRCGQAGFPRVFKDSSFMPRGSAPYWILIIIFFPISLIYYFHMEQKYSESKKCASCGGDGLIQASSPAARQLVG